MGFLDKMKDSMKAGAARSNASGIIIGGANKGCLVAGVVSETLNDKKNGLDYIESADTLKVTTAKGDDVTSFTSADVKSYKIIATTHTTMFIKITFTNGEVSTVKVATMSIKTTNGQTVTTYTHDADDIISVLATCDVE